MQLLFLSGTFYLIRMLTAAATILIPTALKDGGLP